VTTVNRGCVIWFTGLSGAGKSTLSTALAGSLRMSGRSVEVLDGDEVRTHLSAGLSFSKEDRDINVRRIGFVARLLAKHGVTAITAAISPYRLVRDEIRAACVASGISFIEIYVFCPIETLTARDVKGLYKRALAGEIERFTGVSDPYEPPLAPEILVDSSRESPQESLNKIVSFLRDIGCN
jgi:adenylyl-sulfate kinase